ncbi:acyltransferase family protein [Alteribacillus sp. HJP-4]|uniref:acyltransferase family protein n=1 Tax=Alteribacillus sp. HJP-4 TaxID=2775394 RepID=UPI0035CD2319
MTQLKRTGALDIFRLIAAFLVVSIHTAPLSSINDTADFALTRIIGRVAVPFFIMVTGYFLNKAIQNRENRYIKGSILKLSTIYGISILLFLPINIYTGEALTWADLVKDILFDGTFYHLWYLPAMIVAIPLVTFALQRFGLTISWVGSAIMYGVGLLGDSYYGLVEQADKLSTFYDFIFTISEYTRNGLFYVPIFLVLGVALAKSNRRLSRQQILIGLGISCSLLLIEGLVLHSLSWQRHDSMYILLVPCMYYLFLLLLQLPGIKSKALRNLALVIYLIHPAIIIVVRVLLK